MVVAFFIYYLPIDLVLENNFQTRYTTGPSVYFSYGVSGVLVLIMLILIIKNFKNILNKKYIPVLIFFVVGTASIVIQSIFPQLLLLTYVETFICVIMYFTIENPDMKLLRELHKSKEISDNANEEKTLFLYNMTNDIRSITKDIDDSAETVNTDPEDPDSMIGDEPDSKATGKAKMFEELEDEEDVRKAIDLIKDRVANAEEAFIKRNAEDKRKIDNLLGKISGDIHLIGNDF